MNNLDVFKNALDHLTLLKEYYETNILDVFQNALKILLDDSSFITIYPDETNELINQVNSKDYEVALKLTQHNMLFSMLNDIVKSDNACITKELGLVLSIMKLIQDKVYLIQINQSEIDSITSSVVGNHYETLLNLMKNYNLLQSVMLLFNKIIGIKNV